MSGVKVELPLVTIYPSQEGKPATIRFVVAWANAIPGGVCVYIHVPFNGDNTRTAGCIYMNIADFPKFRVMCNEQNLDIDETNWKRDIKKLMGGAK